MISFKHSSLLAIAFVTLVSTPALARRNSTSRAASDSGGAQTSAASSANEGGAGGGVIGSPAGGAIRLESARTSDGTGTKDSSGESANVGYLELKDRATGQRLDLSNDPWALLVSVRAFRVCDDLSTCAPNITELELDGRALSLPAGRYVLELGPSSSQVIEIREGQTRELTLAKIPRPATMRAELALKVVTDLDATSALERLRALFITGRAHGFDRGDFDLATTTIDLSQRLLNRGLARMPDGKLIELIPRADVTNPILPPGQSELVLFAGRYAIGSETQLSFDLGEKWMRDVRVP